MYKSLSERRMAENQTVFRRYNEKVRRSFDRLRRIAAKEKHFFLAKEDDRPMHFYCECSDENCRQRIRIKPSTYDKIHKRRDRFIIIKGHEVDSIEKVFAKRATYNIVEKFEKPSETSSGLQPTPLQNA